MTKNGRRWQHNVFLFYFTTNGKPGGTCGLQNLGRRCAICWFQATEHLSAESQREREDDHHQFVIIIKRIRDATIVEKKPNNGRQGVRPLPPHFRKWFTRHKSVECFFDFLRPRRSPLGFFFFFVVFFLFVTLSAHFQSLGPSFYFVYSYFERW